MAAKQKPNGTIKKSDRVFLRFNEKQMELLDSLKGEMGNDRADVLKSIFLAWLSEKGIASELIKKRLELE